MPEAFVPGYPEWIDHLRVILPLLDVSGNADHFVVVTGWDSQRGDFLVNDPGEIRVHYLNDVWSLPVVSYNPKDANGNPTKFTQLTITQSLNSIGKWKVYTKNALTVKDPLTPQALGIYTQDPVEFILTDPLGRRTGYDPVTNTSFQEISAPGAGPSPSRSMPRTRQAT